MSRALEITGQVFNRLTALYKTKRNKHGSMLWIFQCTCGNTIETVAYEVKSNKTKSCGCWIRDCTINRNKAGRIHPNKKSKQLKSSYGITLAYFNGMLELQNSVCAICNEPQKGKYLAVDHCHETGKVRGLLCENCNKALGQFHDNITLLKSAIAYLEKHSEVI